MTAMGTKRGLVLRTEECPSSNSYVEALALSGMYLEIVKVNEVTSWGLI